MTDREYYYVIGDVNGRGGSLRSVFDRIFKGDVGRHSASLSKIVMMGNYFGYGTEDEQVIKQIDHARKIANQAEIPFVTLTGYRDLLLRGFIYSTKNTDLDFFSTMLRHGWAHLVDGDADFSKENQGRIFERERQDCATLARNDKLETIHKNMQRVFSGCDYLFAPTFSYMTDEFYFCHRGVDPKKPLEKQSLVTLTGLNKLSDYFVYYACGKVDGRTIVHTSCNRKGRESRIDGGEGRIRLRVDNPSCSETIPVMRIESTGDGQVYVEDISPDRHFINPYLAMNRDV